MKGDPCLTLPPDIVSYLTKDEQVLKIAEDVQWGTKTETLGFKELKLGKGEIYVTNQRVIFKKGGGFLERKEIVEVSYRHISSMEMTQESRLGYVTGGIILLVSAFFIWWFVSDIIKMHGILQSLTGLLCLILGVIGIALFFVTTPKHFTIHIVGRKPMVISGELEEIIKIIREYREKVLL